MNKNVGIYFKFQGRMYSLMLKTSVEEITLCMIEARICKKLALDESYVKLQLSYIPLLVGCEEHITISDEEDMSVYLASIDSENRRCLLYVEVINISELPEQLSKAVKSSVGMNYDELHSKDDEIGGNAIIEYVDNEAAKEKHAAREDDFDDDTSRDECVDNGIDRSDMRDEYVEPQAVVEYSQFKEAWDDGLGLSVRQEFRNRKALQEVVDRAAFVNSFGYARIKSDKTRLVLKCRIENCKWGLRAAVIPKTDIFSIRTYTKMHTCSRASQSTSNRKRTGSKQLVASYLNDVYPGEMETPRPKIIMDLIKRQFGVQISYSTALRGKSQAVQDFRGSPEESYKMLNCYLYMLKEANDGTITSVKLDEGGEIQVSIHSFRS